MVMMEIELKRSVRLMALLLTVGLLAAISIALADLPVWIQLALALGLFGALSWAVRQWRRPLPNLRIKPDGQIQLGVLNSEWQHVAVMPGSFVSPGLSVVRLRTKHTLHSVILMPDSASADALRRLRLSLHWGPRTRSDTASPDAG